MQNRPFKILTKKIIAWLPNVKVDHEGVSRVGCEKSGRFWKAEISREQRLQQKPRSGKKNILVWDGSLPNICTPGRHCVEDMR